MKGKFKAHIVFWRRMKDDIFFVWKLSKKVSPEDFKSYLNSIEPRIQFTLDMEKDRILNFTDLTITREERRFVMKVYRKDTHTNKYINWKLNVPMVTKTGSIKTLIFRAYDLCTEIKDRNEEEISASYIHCKRLSNKYCRQDLS